MEDPVLKRERRKEQDRKMERNIETIMRRDKPAAVPKPSSKVHQDYPASFSECAVRDPCGTPSFLLPPLPEQLR